MLDRLCCLLEPEADPSPEHPLHAATAGPCPQPRPQPCGCPSSPHPQRHPHPLAATELKLMLWPGKNTLIPLVVPRGLSGSLPRSLPPPRCSEPLGQGPVRPGSQNTPLYRKGLKKGREKNEWQEHSHLERQVVTAEQAAGIVASQVPAAGSGEQRGHASQGPVSRTGQPPPHRPLGQAPTRAAAQGPSLPPCPLYKAAGIPTSVFAPQLKAPLTALGLSGREAAIRKINQMSHQLESIRRVNVK